MSAKSASARAATTFAGLGWRGTSIVFAANWLYNAAPGKWRGGWFSGMFEQRVAYFARGNPLGPVHRVLDTVVLPHPTIAAALSTAGETMAALLLLYRPTMRLGGAVAAIVALCYTLGSGWVNIGYATHSGSFAALGLLIAGVGPDLRPGSGWSVGAAAMAGIAGAALTWQLGHRWEGWWPAVPWVLASLALMAACLSAMLCAFAASRARQKGNLHFKEVDARVAMEESSLIPERRWVRPVTVSAAGVAAGLDATLLWPDWSGTLHLRHLRTVAYLAATTGAFVLAPAAAGILPVRPMLRSALLATGIAGSAAVAIRAVPFRGLLALGVALALSTVLEAAGGSRWTMPRKAAVLAGGAIGTVPLLLI